ncbi:MAG TPA: non-ribosomal peptide synthetase [Longimicrobiaceae bacterium]|nr:non-ribosomal peptide synthetase [Longimicrobiaceae bacterium]
MSAAAHPPVHRAFGAQARRTPGAVAVEAGGVPVSYAELDARADALAARLAGLGVGPETRVGICMERSAEMVVALLAVLRAGGAYVPLDPSYPAERLAYMLADSAVPVLLTQERLRGRLPEFGGEIVALDTPHPPAPSPTRGEGEHDGVEDADALSHSRTFALSHSPSHLAYVIYTSGSTGRPKGVMVPHGALASHMAWMGRDLPLAAGDRVLQKTPFSFDASVWEFWAPLLGGATLVMAPPGAERDPAGLVRLAARERVTVLQVVPTLLRAMLEAGGLEECRALRLLFCGGEALTAELAERARAATGAEVVNLYGPTETCIQATWHRHGGGGAEGMVPIGRAVDGVRAHVLDDAGAAAAEGELYLGGVQVARGYLGRPEGTAASFVPDPFSGEAGARLYRTGDRVRVLPGGALEWLGRLDGQEKVRGFRVEPGEVEAALLRCPGVREAAAAVRRSGPGDARLVGYAVPREGVPLAPAELRRALAAELPAHLVPSAVVVLDRLPLTPGGKLDRAALPAPEPAGTGGYVAPRTPTEERLAEIWREVLRVDRVGAGDHFFDLGGHSLLATQVASRVRVRMGVEVAIQQLFDTPTLAAMAAFLDRAEEARVAALLAEIEGLSDEEAGALYLAESALHADDAPAREARP